MLRYMLDTDMCIYAMKRRFPLLIVRFQEEIGTLCISAITLGELTFGAVKSERSARSFKELELFLELVEVLAVGPDEAREYGKLRAELERLGTPCGSNDTLIGAHARSLGLTLVTNNRREFDRMPGLKVENWV